MSPSTNTWIGTGSGVSGLGLAFSATQSYGRAEIYIDRGKQTENKEVFDILKGMSASIETKFGGALVWERLENKQACRIKAEAPGNIYDRECWPDMIVFMVDVMVRLENAIKEPLVEVARTLRGRS